MLEKIKEKQNKAAKLADGLEESLRIQVLFPDIFEHGSVKFGGMQQMRIMDRKIGFIYSYFTLGNGERRYLTKTELMKFKPDAIVHEYYQYGSK